MIIDAISRQKWPGEAVVNVSLVNWIHQPTEKPEKFMLDNEPVVGISTRLRESKLAIEEFEPLPQNAGKAFQGPIPAGDFYLEKEEAYEILSREEANYADVVRPFLVGDDIAEDPEQAPRRYVVDFGFRTLEEAALYPAALDVVREKVKPFRDKNRDHGFRTYWWRFGRPRGDMRRAIDPLSRYIAGNRVGKRFLFTWVDKEVCAGDATNIFAFEDDYAMGILMSSTHQTWARAEASTLRVDLRYTPTSCFQTFPWPDATESQREEIASAIRNLLERRRAICVERDIGLTELYNFVEEGGFRDLAALHDRLDKSVAAAYGWPSSVASEPLEIRVRLAALHAEALAGASLV